MTGLIVYNEVWLEKNRFFADKLKCELNLLGVETKIVTEEEAVKFRPDFAVMRVYNEQLNAHFDRLNVRTFNNSRVASICNDKWKTYVMLEQAGIPCALTQRLEECDLPYPRIVKARHGHGGSEVFWVSNEREMTQIREKSKDAAIVQPPVGKRGRDLRVYVIGGEPIVAMLRCSDSDFRSNYSLGGYAKRYELKPSERALVKKTASLMDFDFVGIDFLIGDEGLICNEIEDAVGCRMVYALTDIDIIKIYARHIVCSLKTLEK